MLTPVTGAAIVIEGGQVYGLATSPVPLLRLHVCPARPLEVRVAYMAEGIPHIRLLLLTQPPAAVEV